ncbi:MAG: hypothetical protein R3251_02850 [Candidatus Spechtbacterales bacterium]|nr:hypothetical protein [Candidatus Spechtbacterales bacterium]
MSKTSEVRLLKDKEGKVILYVCDECSAVLNDDELRRRRCPDYGHKLILTNKERKSTFDI